MEEQQIKIYRIVFTMITISFFNLSWIQAQSEIRIRNNSFEGYNALEGLYPNYFDNIKQWHTLSNNSNISPDVFGTKVNKWGVDIKPYDGKSCIGLVIRPDSTYEVIGQKLSEKLISGKKYQLRIFLTQSKSYYSALQSDIKTEVSFTNPSILLVSGYNKKGKEIFQLAKSEIITIGEWKEHVLEFIPDKDYNFLALAAFWPDGLEKLTTGHVIMDKVSLFLIE